MSRLIGLLVVCVLCAGGARGARADVSDLMGMDARTRGMGMATLTLCEDYTAAVCNPAAGAMAERISVGLGYSFTLARLKLNGAVNEVLDIRGVPVGEAMVACVLADHMLRHRAQCG